MGNQAQDSLYAASILYSDSITQYSGGVMVPAFTS